MLESTKFSPRASLIALGNYLENTVIWQIIEQEVQIKQKVLRHKPTDKLKDAWISMLAGAQSLVEINTLVRPDKALQKAFGREACADQSKVSETLNACDEQTVKQRAQRKGIFLTRKASAGDNWGVSWQVAMMKWWWIAYMQANDS